MRIVLCALVCLLILSCKDKTEETLKDAVVENGALQGPTPTNPEDLTIPSSCDMISAEDIKSILSVPAAAVNMKPNDEPEGDTRSCFFQWDDPATPNAGIMLMIQTNPVFEEAPDYFTRSLKAKLQEGETVLGQDKPMKFKEFEAGDGVGAYSFDQSRFYWTKGNDYMFMLAFNISTLSESKMVSAAEKIVAKVNANFGAQSK